VRDGFDEKYRTEAREQGREKPRARGGRKLKTLGTAAREYITASINHINYGRRKERGKSEMGGRGKPVEAWENR